jgi:hypothetical protein
MSRIVDYRDKVVEFVRTNIKEIREVDWYDGLFDADDIKRWALKTPAAFVAITDAPTENLPTGESQANLSCVLVVIDQDKRKPRDADTRVWNVLEKATILFKLQTFGYEWASATWNLDFQRLKDPEMRREGVAVGVVTWKAGVTIGDNTALRRDQIFDLNGDPILQVPPRLSARETVYGQGEHLEVSEPDLSPLPWPGKPWPPDGELDPEVGP